MGRNGDARSEAIIALTTSHILRSEPIDSPALIHFHPEPCFFVLLEKESNLESATIPKDISRRSCLRCPFRRYLSRARRTDEQAEAGRTSKKSLASDDGSDTRGE